MRASGVYCRENRRAIDGGDERPGELKKGRRTSSCPGGAENAADRPLLLLVAQDEHRIDASRAHGCNRAGDSGHSGSKLATSPNVSGSDAPTP